MKFMMKFWLLVFGVLMLANAASAESPREQLKQMVAQLQKSSSDGALREKIIKLAQKFKPAPAVPEEARRHFVKAVTLQKEAKSPEDYDLPILEYRQALLLAPWWSDAYFDLASALELKQQYAEAIQNLKFSILASPTGPDARAAQDEIYALEAKSEKQKKEKSEQESARAAEGAAREMATREKFIDVIQGRWNREGTPGSGSLDIKRLDKGKMEILFFGQQGSYSGYDIAIAPPKLSVTFEFPACPYAKCPIINSRLELTLDAKGRLTGSQESKEADETAFKLVGYPTWVR